MTANVLARDYEIAATPRGSGGFADVFEAVRRADQRAVAVKVLRGEPPSVDALVRLEREVVVMQALAGNPHVVQVIEADPDGRWYVMPLAQASLAERLADLTNVEMVEVLRAVCDGLVPAHSHANRYIHRDLSPSNILLVDGFWVVADWGMVRPDASRFTKTGVGVGTEGWSAPEVLRGDKDVQPSADVFSLGALVKSRFNPVGGPWATFVGLTHRREPSDRLPDATAVLGLIERLFPSPKPIANERDAEALLGNINYALRTNRAVQEAADRKALFDAFNRSFANLEGACLQAVRGAPLSKALLENFAAGKDTMLVSRQADLPEAGQGPEFLGVPCVFAHRTATPLVVASRQGVEQTQRSRVILTLSLEWDTQHLMRAALGVWEGLWEPGFTTLVEHPLPIVRTMPITRVGDPTYSAAGALIAAELSNDWAKWVARWVGANH